MSKLSPLSSNTRSEPPRVAPESPADWPVLLSEGFVAQCVPRLCSWFDEHRRDLPWRANRDPYSIWISEAMLQQTRVETVFAYHKRFLAALPQVRDLARAEEAQVLSLWSGLGYYRRARALHAAAGVIMDSHAGRFPMQRREFLDLPGVGPYTAGAVLSMAFQQSEALVDGNVGRVFSRLFGLRAEISSGSSQRLLWSIARFLVPSAVDLAPGDATPLICPGNWNQALMELGALVCTPTNPSCELCPLIESCVAQREGLTSELPLKRKQMRSVNVRIEVLLLRQDERILLVQRPTCGRMEGLWELPTRELPDATGREFGLWPRAYSVGVPSEALELGVELGRVSHAITKHRIKGSLISAGLSSGANAKTKAGLRWATASECRQLAITGLTRKCLGVAELLG